MRKYEVWVTIWSEAHKAQIKIVAGEFREYHNARLFAKAYENEFNAKTEIIEYTS